jgi:hypothetical protein
MKVMCIDDLVDGVGLFKLYEVKDIKGDGKYYLLKDDYGQYNEYKSSRFISISHLNLDTFNTSVLKQRFIDIKYYIEITAKQLDISEREVKEIIMRSL